MPESIQQPRSLRPKVIRNIGIGLFVLSFLAPPRWRGGDDFHLFGGCAAFIQTPVIACQAILANRDEAPSHSTLLFIVMMAAWIANLTIFTRMPLAIAVISILLPWPAYFFLFSESVSFIPFYPWAAGIALIHLSRVAQPWDNEITGANAGGPRQFPMRTYWAARIAQFFR
jgi:hypothetical protein